MKNVTNIELYENELETISAGRPLTADERKSYFNVGYELDEFGGKIKSIGGYFKRLCQKGIAKLS